MISEVNGAITILKLGCNNFQKMRNELFRGIDEHNKSLIHVCQCQDGSCELSNCNRMRQIVDHTKTCKIRVKRNCPTCTKLMHICFYHAKYCQNASCTLPLCPRMKQALMDQELKERLEQAKLRRRRLVDMMRQIPNQRAGKRPPGSN